LFFPALASADVDFKKTFADRDACFVIADLETGKILAEHNPKRCKERFSPCSSFKVPAALMAFDKGILNDENQDHLHTNNWLLLRNYGKAIFLFRKRQWTSPRKSFSSRKLEAQSFTGKPALAA
jgi:hypothetical protein